MTGATGGRRDESVLKELGEEAQQETCGGGRPKKGLGEEGRVTGPEETCTEPPGLTEGSPLCRTGRGGSDSVGIKRPRLPKTPILTLSGPVDPVVPYPSRSDGGGLGEDLPSDPTRQVWTGTHRPTTVVRCGPLVHVRGRSP